MSEQQWNRIKYVGVLNLLCRCSPHVDEDLRDCIEMALADACKDGKLKYYNAGKGFAIEVVP